MEKSQLVNFISTMMEKSGFRVYKNFKTSDMIVDIYGVLPTLIGDFRAVITCKNYDKQYNVGLEILKDMEMVSRKLKASRIAVVASSSFSSQAINYAARKNIKLIDREDLIKFAKKFTEENYEVNNGIISSPNDMENHGSNLKFNNSSDSNPRDTFLLRKTNKEFQYENKNKLSSISSKNNKQSLEYSAQDTFNITKKRMSPRIILRAILNNIIVMVVTVVLLSYFIPYTLGKLGIFSGGRIIGISKILLSLILSYGLVLLLNKNKTVWIIKGTILFFISVVVLIILVIFMK